MFSAAYASHTQEKLVYTSYFTNDESLITGPRS